MITEKLRRMFPRYSQLTDWNQASELARDIRDLFVALFFGIDEIENRVVVLETQPRVEMYMLDNTTALTLTTQNTWYPVVANWVAGESVQAVVATTAGTIAMRVDTAIRALAALSLNFSAIGVYELAFFVDGVQEAKSRIKLDGTTAVVNTLVTCVLNATAGQSIDLRARCTSAAGLTVTVRNANFSLARI